jgi:hypothetical protein
MVKDRQAALERAASLMAALRLVPDPADRAYALDLERLVTDPGSTDGALGAGIATGERILADAGRRQEAEAELRDQALAAPRERAEAERREAEREAIANAGDAVGQMVVGFLREHPPPPIDVLAILQESPSPLPSRYPSVP